MRILILNHNVAWKGGGTFFRTYHYGRHLARRGHEVTLLTISRIARRGFQHKVADGGLRLVETPDLLWGMGRSGWDPWNTLNRIAFIRRQYRQRLEDGARTGTESAGNPVRGSGLVRVDPRPFDIVHGFDSRPAVVLPALYAQKAHGLPLVLDWCDWWGRGGTNSERANPVVRTLMAPVETFFEEAFRGHPDGTTALGQPLYRRALATGVSPDRIIELAQGCDLDGIRPMEVADARRRVGLPEEGVYLGYLGVLRPKNLPFLLDIMEMVRRYPAYANARLLLIGNHKVDLDPAWARGGREYIVETGWITYEQVAAYLGASDVLLLPLLDTVANNGIWPSKLNDYLSAGRPIVSTRMDVLEDLWQRRRPGLFAGNDDPQRFAEAVVTLLDDVELRAELGANARAAAEDEFDWRKLAQKLEGFYQKVLDSVKAMAHDPSGPEPPGEQPTLITVEWADRHAPPGYQALKRALDSYLCLVVFFLGMPVWLAIALSIKLTSPGPVFYRGAVVGKGGRAFRYYKFRTMVVGGDNTAHREWLEKFVKEDAAFAEGESGRKVFKVVDDPRVTRVGRWLRKLSLDEVPQMLNVLRGEMSLVGPRPPVPYEYEHYDQAARQRLSVTPGITGLYQVTARSQVGFTGMLAIDLDYIRRRSIWLDLWIMLRTPWVMLTGKGAG